jgi:hypothetical protein
VFLVLRVRDIGAVALHNAFEALSTTLSRTIILAFGKTSME